MEALKEVESKVVNVENRKYYLRRKKVEPTTIPHDIVEIILLQLPVKDLIRFKVVSKQWKATISDPTFAGAHFQQHKNSSSQRNLLAWYNSEDLVSPEFLVARLQKNRFKDMLKIKFPRKSPLLRGSGLMCSCDGLYLIRLCITLGKTYAVCNPSCRGYREIRSPQKIVDTDSSQTLYGIYYNPSTIDHSVVIADKKHYAVFSCRYNKWSEVKEMEEIYSSCHVPGERSLPGVSFSGSLYWLGTQSELVIICFDGKDGKFKKLAMPDCRGGRSFYLASSPGHLCLFYSTCHNAMMIMKTDGKEPWMEFKVQSIPCRFYMGLIYPICWVSEDVIILGGGGRSYYMIYELSKSIERAWKDSYLGSSSHPLPYLESLFLQ